VAKRKISINRLFLIYLALVGFLSIGTLGFLWVDSEWKDFQREAETLRISYIESQKEVLRHETQKALDFVHYTQSRNEQRLDATIKHRVYEAIAIAENIYNQEKGSASKKKIENTIREALRPIRFNKGRGYYFAFNLEGIETLFAVNPKMEGQSMLEVRGGNDERVVPDMLTLVANEGEGYYRYTWPKPGRKGFFPKIAYVKLFEPLGWVIGTGEYIDDVEKDIQEECLNWISSIRFGEDGYVFVGRWDGLSLSGPATGRNMYEVEDINGVKIVQELITAAKAGGGFVSYVLPKFEGKKHAPKLSYALGVPQWQWYIGSGVYVDEIETTIEIRQEELETRIKADIRDITVVLGVLSLLIFGLVKLLSNRIRKNLEVFTDFFKRASTGATTIEQQAVHFAEFSQLAESANAMVHNQRMAEKALRESEKHLKALIENAPDAFFAHDADGRILIVNEQACKSLGYSKNQLVGMHVMDIDVALTDDSVRAMAKKVAQSDVIHFEGSHQRKDGSRFPVEGRLSSIETNGELLIFGFVRDITEREAMEKEKQRYQSQLNQAQKMEAIGTLAGGMAHDFNNLLMGIQGRASIISYELEAGHPSLEHVRSITEYIKNASDLTKQLLGVAQGGKYEVKPIDINEVVRASANLFGRTKKEIRIHTKLRQPSPVAVADRNQIEQVLLNLYINAWQAMPGGGKLLLETTVVDLDHTFCRPHNVDPGTFVRISVTDTGIGMDSTTRQRIFDPFFTTKEKGRGTGLGLASAYGIVQNHDGIISVYSEVGQGTTFHIYLPFTKTEAHKDQQKPQEPIRGSETILLIDDEEMITDVGQTMLTNLGYEVMVAGSGKEAVEIVRSANHTIDLVVLDMIMPGMDGGTTFTQIREILPDVPVILSSGYSKNEQAEEIMRRGCNGFIQKPFHLSDLSEKIRTILDSHKAVKK
jgi:PAS domain S-box-containing protein